MDPTVELVMRHPTPGPEPLATVLVMAMAVWVFGTPWVRLCWWLGARARAR